MPSIRSGHYAGTDTSDPPTRLPDTLALAPAIRAASGRRPHFGNAYGAAAAAALGTTRCLGSGGFGGPVLHVFGGAGFGGAVAGMSGGCGRRIADGSLFLGRQRRAR